MNLVRIVEILEEKEGKRKKTNPDGSVAYTPWHWRKFKGETTIDGVPKEMTISTFSHIEKGKLYEGDLTQEDYKGNPTWKFDAKGEFESAVDKSQDVVPPPSKPTQALPVSTLEVRIAAGKLTALYYDKANCNITLQDWFDTMDRFCEQLTK